MATAEDMATMVGTMSALTTTLQQLLTQGLPQGQQLPKPEQEGYNKKWHEVLSKRTETFDGENFTDWKFKLRLNASALLNDKFVIALDEFAAHNKEIKYNDFKDYSGADWESASRHLFSVLADKLKGEPLTLIKGISDMNGYEAWRKLNNRYDSKTIGKRVGLIRRLVGPPKIKHLKDVTKSIEIWEETARVLKRDYKEELSDGLLMGILLEMIPAQVAESLMPRLPDPNLADTAYIDTKELILQLVEHKTDFMKPVPMDCSTFQDVSDKVEPGAAGEGEEDIFNFNQKGGGKGKGKGGGRGPCWNCGELGHRAVECPQKSEWKYPQTRYPDGGKGWQKGTMEKGGKGLYAKGGGKNVFGKWGKPSGFINNAYSFQKGKGGKAGGWSDWKGKGQAYGLDQLSDCEWSCEPVGETWPLSICSVEEVQNHDAEQNRSRPTIITDIGGISPKLEAKIRAPNETHFWSKSPIVKANSDKKVEEFFALHQSHPLADFIKFKQPKPSTKPTIVENRFSALDDLDEMQELTLEDGVKVDVIEPKVPNLTFPSVIKHDHVNRNRSKPKINFRTKLLDKSCGCCSSQKNVVERGSRMIGSILEKDGNIDEEEKEVIGAFFDRNEGIHSLSEPEWVPIEVVMDSGAAESVAPSHIAPWIKTRESVGSREGREYLSASGDVLKNLGEKNLEVVTSEGIPATTTFQIADVTRPLCSIAKVCDKGNRVIFDSNGGYVEDSWGHRTRFHRRGNIYTMSFFALDPGSNGPQAAPVDFHRPSS